MQSPPATPAQMRDLIVERLTGATGDPRRVSEAARACAERARASLAEPFAELFSASLALELAGVELCRFGDARPAADGFGAMVIVPAETSPDALLLTADAEAIAIAVSALFGGDPGIPLAPIRRPLSTIERDVAGRIFTCFAEAFNGSGTRALNIRRPVPAPVCGPELGKQVVRDGPAVNIAFELSYGAASGAVTVTMPQRVLLAHRGEATAATQPMPPARWRERFGEEVMRSNVTLSATIPLPRMTLGEIAMLAPGQVIELPEGAQTSTRLAARGNVLFNCEFGKLGKHYTVRVLQPFDAEQDLVDSILSQ